MEVGVRELQTKTSKILQEVTERHTTVAITRRGRVIARIVPADEGLTEEERVKTIRILEEIDKLAVRIGERWPHDVSAVQAIREQRR